MIDYDSFINQSIKGVKPSGIRKFFDIAIEMDNVISLSIGEPDFKTPWHIREAGIRSLEKGKTWYSPNRGFMKLREEICHYYKRRFNVFYNPEDEVVVTVGGSEGIDLALRTIVEKGDEVLIPQPAFVCYEPLTYMAGGKPVFIETKAENNFRLTKEELESSITDKTKVLVLPFPNNPTGAIMEREDLESIAEVIIRHNLFVISDEIYGELTYGGKKHVSIADIEGMKERTIIVSGFSKAYAMTGWRLGYLLGPEPIMSQILKLHQYGIMSSPTTAQYAAIEALRNGDDDVAVMRKDYDLRRRLIVGKLNEIGLSCFEPLGAFYAFPCIKSTGLSSDEFSTRLVKEKRIAVVPGSAFGECGEGFIRISYAQSLKNIKTALKRIEEFVKEVKNENKG
ncbi:MAG: aminotransferase class I/II-fold pyridoxal phosphate-dependent enzyme [Ruminococcus sp.]|nr:aminotransferase class I/II-fold pyridoxal phosphate-dependent enzyme [Ruminococcus sp.]